MAEKSGLAGDLSPLDRTLKARGVTLASRAAKPAPGKLAR